MDNDEHWRPMSEPVADAVWQAGPHGSMEFREDRKAWRALYPDGTPVPTTEGPLPCA